MFPQSLTRTVFAFLFASSLIPAAFAQDADRAPAPSRFLAVAAERLHADAAEVQLERVEGPVHLNELNVDVFVAGATISDQSKTLVALTADGKTVDLKRAFELERLMSVSRHGKLSRRLAEEAKARPLNERLPVIAWVTAPDVDDVRSAFGEMTESLDQQGLMTQEIAETNQRELASEIERRIAPATEDAAARLTAAGFQVIGRDTLAPVVFLEADATELARLQSNDSIQTLEWAGTNWGPRLNIAVGEIRANWVWSQPGGVNGVGAKVSIVEGGTVCDQNPFMPLAAERLGGFPHDNHTTAVGSCVSGNHPLFKGAAPGATLISANGADFVTGSTNVTTQMPNSVAAISWSVAQGAQIMNLSYGAAVPNATVSSFDKYLDYVVRTNARTICIAAGNSGGFAGDPGAGYNAIAVGSFNDLRSPLWGGEVMAPFSSWMNPSTGVETPQVVAPGVNINMLTCAAPWASQMGSGTSFSSPLVAGECALLVSKQPALGTWPEAVRAIVMATAWHNIEGWPALSSRDGAGGVDALAGFRVIRRGKGVGYNYGTLFPTSFDPAGFAVAQQSGANAGQIVRVCLSWDSTPGAAPTYAPDRLLADLDLYVFGPNGALVASSATGLQPFEMLQFTAPQTGIYTVKIRRFTFAGASEFYGSAFTTNADI